MVTYIPPKITTQNILSNTGYYDSLLNSNFKYKDLNGHTGIEDHTSCLDNQISQLLLDTNWCSCDDKANTYGSILLKLCNSHNLKIANGQTPGDRVRNYTCFNRGGAIVVDYL